MQHRIYSKKINKGFTIVELLVVIVVIGILAAITIVSYTGVTARANVASAISTAAATNKKVIVYNVDGPGSSWPTTYAHLTSAPSTATYYLNGVNFTVASNNTQMNATNIAAAQYNVNTNKTVDFSLCGTGSAAAATSYSTVTVPTGIRIGYWNVQTGTLDVSNVAGTTSGNWTNGYAINCYKVGIAEAVMAVVRDYFSVNGAWPTTATQITTGTTNTKIPTGVTVQYGATALDSAHYATWVEYMCKTGGCANGGRIRFWDMTTGAISTAANSVYFGGATSADTFVNAGA